MKQLNDIKSVLELLIYLKQRNIIKLYLINVWCAAHCATELFPKKLQLLIQFFIDTRPLWRNILYCEAGVRPATPEGKKKTELCSLINACCHMTGMCTSVLWLMSVHVAKVCFRNTGAAQFYFPVDKSSVFSADNSSCSDRQLKETHSFIFICYVDQSVFPPSLNSLSKLPLC